MSLNILKTFLLFFIINCCFALNNFTNVYIKEVGKNNYWRSTGFSVGDNYWLSHGVKTGNMGFDIFNDLNGFTRIRKNKGGSWLDWNNTHKYLAFYDASGNFVIEIVNGTTNQFRLKMSGYYVKNSNEESSSGNYVRITSTDISDSTIYEIVN